MITLLLSSYFFTKVLLKYISVCVKVFGLHLEFLIMAKILLVKL